MSKILGIDPDFSSQFDSDNNFHAKTFQMKQEIDRLTEENNAFRNQIHEATTMGELLENTYKQISKLTKELRIANSERDDLQKRLNISLQRNDELTKQLKQEHISPPNLYRSPKKEDNTILHEKDKLAWQNEKNDLKLKINELQQILNNEQKKNASIQSSIETLLDVSQSNFQRPFSTINDVISYLPQIITSSPKNTHQNSTIENDDVYRSKIKKQKNKIKELKQLYSASDFKLVQYEKGIQKSRNEGQVIIAGLESQINELQHNYQLEEMKYQHDLKAKDTEIKNLQSKIDLLEKQQPKETNTDTESTSEITELKQQIQSLKSKLHESNKVITQLKNTHAQLSHKLSEVTAMNETMRKRNASSDSQVITFREENEKLHNSFSSLQFEYNKLQEQYQTTISKIQTLEASLSQKESSSSELYNSNEKLSNSISILEQTLEKQKSEINSLYNEREKMILILQKENALLTNYETQIARLSKENKYIKDAMGKERLINQDRKNDIETEIKIPYSSWFTNDFPQDLCSVMTETINNEGLQLPVKLKYVMAIISKYYTSKLAELDIQLKECSTEKENKEQQCENIYNELYDIANQLNIPYYKSNTQSFFTQLKNQLNDKEDTIEQLNDTLSRFYSKFGTNDKEETLNTIDKLLQAAEKMKRIIENQKAKMSQKKKEFQQFKQKCISKQKEIESLVSNQQDQYASEIQEKEALIDKIKSLEELNETLNANLIRMNSQHKEILDEHEVKCDGIINNLKQQIDDVRNHYSQELNIKDQQILEFQHNIQQLRKEIVQWKRTTELIKKGKVEKENQILDLTAKLDEREKSRLDQIEREKTSIKSQYEQFIEHIKSKNEELRILILKSSKALEDLQKKNKALMTSCTKLTIENQQGEAKIQSLKEELEREHRLMETKLRASTLSIELQLQNSVEELKSQTEFEKRNIFSYIANAFRQFFNGSEVINDEPFKTLVEKVRFELQRLFKQESALRSMLGISRNESLEQHISQLLLEMYSSKT